MYAPPPQAPKTVIVGSAFAVDPTVGPQGQELYPCITADSCGTSGLSAGMVVMPPGRHSRPHFHAHSEIVVCCIVGSAVTLVGPDLTPVHHGPGEIIYIPDGVLHVAVNLSTTATLVAVEMRTDPAFNDDVVVVPDLDDAVTAAAEGARARFGGTASRVFWEHAAVATA
jgi:uncharacterized RmlC-like cupin family protein